ncbi:unnamed protein product [Fusarium equiseti]|uniref:AB hydrolase-1 domain-containing protein n=1 Tax=Fusarium equiseti TaxID=61235 RepID=A0A8J2IHU2_FUSEQ|nr:unnamed protein product [Fusarium equiseti]
MAANLETKSLTTTDGRKYTYDYVPAKGNKSTVLLIHGYPATRYDWKYQIEDLSAAGYGVIAPDCLGYGDSDKPLEIEAYNLKNMSKHLTEILDKEGLKTVVGVGHDWGVSIVSRAVVWHPDRFEKVVFLSLGYGPPGILLDIDTINAKSLKEFGNMPFGYFYFFNSHDGASLAAQHLESFFHLVFPTENLKWTENLGALGAARAWLNNNTITPLPNYMTEEDKSTWMAEFSKPNATETSMNYYKALLRGVNAKDEENLTNEDRTLHVPVLTVGGSEDVVARPENMGLGTEPFAAAGWTHKVVNAGHWMMYEDREGLRDALLEFLEQ